MIKKSMKIIFLMFIVLAINTTVFASEQHSKNIKIEFDIDEQLEKMDYTIENNSNKKDDKKVNINVKEKMIIKNLFVEKTNQKDLRDNTNPNDAQVVGINTVIKGNIAVEGENRWYGTVIDEKMKLTTIVALSKEQDFDLYIYKLNEETMSLELMSYSTNKQGVNEVLNSIVSSGTYYFRVNGYSGTGEFDMFFFGSTKDKDMEVNDTFDEATYMGDSGFSYKAIIDNPVDIDIYKLTLSNGKKFKLKLENPSKSNYAVYYSDGENLYKFNEMIFLNPGTHYFVVKSVDGTYSQSDSYLLTGDVVFDNSLRVLAYTEDQKTFLQSDFNRTEYYINGKKIDFSYHFEKHIKNSAGYISTYMNLFPGDSPDIAVYEKECLQQGLDELEFIDYKTNFEGGESKDRVLKASVFNITEANVTRYSGGEYEGEDAHYFNNKAVVIIDPETGKVIDMINPNYYYEFGSQDYSVVRPYNTIITN